MSCDKKEKHVSGRWMVLVRPGCEASVAVMRDEARVDQAEDGKRQGW